jgi:AraC-like DNA-binding protein
MNVATVAYQDPAAIADAYGRVVPLRSFRNLSDDRCLHRLGAVRIRRISLMSLTATPHRIALHDSGHLNLVVCFGGHSQFQGDLQEVATPGRSQVVRCVPGGAALLPVGDLHVEGAHCLALVRFRPAAVAAAAASMAGVEGWDASQSRVFEQFPAQSLPATAPQARVLHSLLRSIDHCLASDPWLAAHLGLDDVLLRTVATWLQPQLVQPSQEATAPPSARSGPRRQPFDDLLEYIRANLDQPLRLSDLEVRSHYSRRALQYAFRQRLGTTPKQWIREQRLQRAMAQLRRVEEKPSIREVAQACGYRHIGHFSSDFKHMYGHTPREVLGCDAPAP